MFILSLRLWTSLNPTAEKGGPRLPKHFGDGQMRMLYFIVSGRAPPPPNKKMFDLNVGGTNYFVYRDLFDDIFPWRTPHPILSLNGFDIAHLKWCSMHALNLGVLQFVTGSSIDLLSSLGAPALWKAKFWFPVLLCFGDPYDSAYHHHLPYSGFFGSLDQPLDQHLRICSARFRKWASVNCIEYLITPAGKLVCFFFTPNFIYC